MHCWCCQLASLARYLAILPTHYYHIIDDIQETFKVAKIIAKTECCKHPKNYYLEVLIYFDYHYLLQLVPGYIHAAHSRPRRTQSIAACFMCPVAVISFHFFYLKMRCQNAIKTRKKLFGKQLRIKKLSFENLLFIDLPCWWFQRSVV